MVIKHPSLPLRSGSDAMPATASEPTAATEQTAPTNGKAKSPPSELIVMGRIERLIEQVPEPARGRVVRWAYEKWCDERGE